MGSWGAPLACVGYAQPLPPWGQVGGGRSAHVAPTPPGARSPAALPGDLLAVTSLEARPTRVCRLTPTAHCISCCLWDSEHLQGIWTPSSLGQDHHPLLFQLSRSPRVAPTCGPVAPPTPVGRRPLQFILQPFHGGQQESPSRQQSRGGWPQAPAPPHYCNGPGRGGPLGPRDKRGKDLGLE